MKEVLEMAVKNFKTSLITMLEDIKKNMLCKTKKGYEISAAKYNYEKRPYVNSRTEEYGFHKRKFIGWS